MWKHIVRFILRYRLFILIATVILTAFMAWMAKSVHMSYELPKMLPAKDSISINYDDFKKNFGQDGAVVFVGFEADSVFTLKTFKALSRLTDSLKKTNGIEEVLSATRLAILEKDTVLKKFKMVPLFKDPNHLTQHQLDSLKRVALSIPFYKGLLISADNKVILMAITLKKDMLNSKARVKLIFDLTHAIDQFGKTNNVKAHISGLPYIRTVTTKKVQDELEIFSLVSVLIAAISLLLFFRSGKAVLIPISIVIISAIWTVGIIGLFGYKITILTGILPPLIIIIGVENCIFLLNRFISEFKKHGNKTRAISIVITRIGGANLLTNATTAAGFGAFVITGNQLLIEFGVVATLSILTVYLLTLTLIPILYSYLPAPTTAQMEHHGGKRINLILDKIVHLVENKRKIVYITVGISVIIAIGGITRLTTSGSIVDDIPHGERLYTDLLYLEKNFKGVMPLEIVIDTKKPKGVTRLNNLRKIDQLQDSLKTYPELSAPLSVVQVVKLGRMAFYGNDSTMYDLPSSQELPFLIKYLPQKKTGKRTIADAFTDSTMQRTRISVQMANVSTPEIDRILHKLQPTVDSIFPKEKYKVTITGSSVVFLKGTTYLFGNLIESLILAIVLIALLLAMLFSSWRIVTLSLIPNLIPQLLTAALMGYMGIPIKPSTILVFSIALGISADNTIQFLSRYRQQLRWNNNEIYISVIKALRETGQSMIFSSLALFLGFSVFAFSTFGGTQAMGYFVSFTLLTAMLTNLFLLPSLLLWLNNWTTKNFEESATPDENDDE